MGAIVLGLGSALDGKAVGDEFQVRVPSAEGFGVRHEAMPQVVLRNHLDEFSDLSLGMRLRVPADDGEVAVAVVEMGDESVILDGSQFLAGTILHFDVVVRETTSEEIAHAHGAGGQHD